MSCALLTAASMDARAFSVMWYFSLASFARSIAFLPASVNFSVILCSRFSSIALSAPQRVTSPAFRAASPTPSSRVATYAAAAPPPAKASAPPSTPPSTTNPAAAPSPAAAAIFDKAPCPFFSACMFSCIGLMCSSTLAASSALPLKPLRYAIRPSTCLRWSSSATLSSLCASSEVLMAALSPCMHSSYLATASLNNPFLSKPIALSSASAAASV
mmetsp:Transcript_58643/g.136924  ORF Transcript_58643/g.136924 Transcript_58643/m.136924 type:complete len:215 (-) Transcript_58643:81-725(-)